MITRQDARHARGDAAMPIGQAMPPSPALHVEASVNGGAAVMRSLTVWPIDSLGGDTVALLHNPNPEQDAPATLDNQQMEKLI